MISVEPENSNVGTPVSRLDGPDKVTGRARYAAEHPAEGLIYGWIVSSAVARGRIISVDDAEARAVDGVVDILTHENRPHIAWFDRSYRDDVAPPGEPFRALYNDMIRFSFQPVAVVFAETLESARRAAALIRIKYDVEEHRTDFIAELPRAYVPKKKRAGVPMPSDRGDAKQAFADAPVQVAVNYTFPTHHHNPMEMHGTTVHWARDGSITVYDKTQGSQNVQNYLAGVFGLSKNKITVRNTFVGGAFGSGLRPQYQVYLATMGALHLKRSVRVTMTRQQMVSHVHRPELFQSVSLACNEAGALQAIINNATTATSSYEDYMENIVNWGLMAYRCPNATGNYTVTALDTPTPGDMRAPGAASGMNVFECAIDELAYAARIDPLLFRRLNYTDVDAASGNPFTSKALREAYEVGARSFGWNGRPLEPRSMQDGHELTGWGVATGIWDAQFMKTSARARLSANGDLEIATAASDIGTGTYTILAQVAAQTLGVPMEDITVKIGDSALPASPVEGGSWMAASAGAAVQLACKSVAQKLFDAAREQQDSVFADVDFAKVTFSNGRMQVDEGNGGSILITELMNHANLSSLEAEETASPGPKSMVSQHLKARNTHSAVFAEVKVDDELGVVRVSRVVVAVAAGRILNPKTARSQILGGVVMGIGMALHEETLMDHRYGRPMNHNFAEYHVPVHADIEDIEVIFIDEKDEEVSPLGVKGLGEIGIVGTAAAVANAIFHATGRRVREFPITLDKLL